MNVEEPPERVLDRVSDGGDRLGLSVREEDRWEDQSESRDRVEESAESGGIIRRQGSGVSQGSKDVVLAGD